MSTDQVVLLLFRLTRQFAERERTLGYAGIAEVKGTYSWSFVEHLNELPMEEQSKLLDALIKRRFALEGLLSDETKLSSQEEREIQHWLSHNNSLHGTRTAPFFAGSVREEELLKTERPSVAAIRREIREALRIDLKSASMPVDILADDKEEIRWQAASGTGITVNGWMDLGSSDEQAGSFFVIQRNGIPLHVSTSYLALLGIGTDSWSFLETGEGSLCSAATVRRFTEIYDAVASSKDLK